MKRNQNVLRRYLFRKDFFRKVNQKLKGQMRKYSKNPIDDQRKILRGIDGPIIFDLGANVGDVTRKYAKIFPRATVYSFEPFPETFSQLLLNVKHLPTIHPQQYAISNEIGEKTLFVSRYDVMNSLLPPTDLAWGFEDQKQVKVPVTTLDEFCTVNDIGEIHILKMDVQGGELDALQGASQLLQDKRIWLIYTELQLIPFYENQPLLFEIAHFLIEYGFSLFNIYNLREGSSRELRWCDGIFVSKQMQGYLGKQISTGFCSP